MSIEGAFVCLKYVLERKHSSITNKNNPKFHHRSTKSQTPYGLSNGTSPRDIYRTFRLGVAKPFFLGQERRKSDSFIGFTYNNHYYSYPD